MMLPNQYRQDNRQDNCQDRQDNCQDKKEFNKRQRQSLKSIAPRCRKIAIAILVLLWSGTGCRATHFTHSTTSAPPTPSNANVPNSSNSTIQSVQSAQSALQSASVAPPPKPARLLPATVTVRLQDLLDRSVDDKTLPGVVLYFSTQSGDWRGVAGKADVAKGTVLKTDDRFRVGSITKMFVAVVCLRLAEEGRLDLDAPVKQWLPQTAIEEFPPLLRDRLQSSITVRQLLNHTSGIPEPYGKTFREAVKVNPSHNWTAPEVLQFVGVDKPTVPTSKFSYSNANYLLLELVIEAVTEEPLAAAIAQYITQPLAMNDTFLERREPIPNGFVQGYQDWNEDNTLENVTQPLINDGLGMGDSGLVSTAPDLVKFSQALFSPDRLLQSDSLKQMLTLVGKDPNGSYGLGIDHFSTPWGEAWGHTGKTMGFTSLLLYFPAHDLTLVVWSNEAGKGWGSPAGIAEESLQMTLGGPDW